MSDPESVIPFHRLPPNFAESIAHPPDVPATPRPAATIVLMRDGTSGLEILMLRRNRKAGFVPGAYVFPGGRVDGSDAEPDVLARLDGLTAAEASRRLALPDGDPPAIAYYLAAVREAFEETGILVAHREDGSAPPTAAADGDIDTLRDDLMEDRVSFGEVMERMGCRIEGDSLEYLAHWITPVVEPRRYDARFFAAKVRPNAEPVVDPREMTDAVWVTPAGALERNRDGTMPMVFPTLKTLQRLAIYRDVDAALAGLGRREVPTILPRLVTTPTGVGMELDEEP
jgi:8-oxo-dGTP pyrophosphatase MutT (NUDIX family)